MSLNKNFFSSNTVVAIPAFFDENEELATVSEKTENLDAYLKHLQDRGAKIFMTTLGTTNMNLLSREESINFGLYIARHTPVAHTILGVPMLSTKRMIEQVKYIERHCDTMNTSLLIRYPDRLYDFLEVSDYFDAIVQATTMSIFIHADAFDSGKGKEKEDWDAYDLNDLLNQSPSKNRIVGIKEELSDLMKASNFVSELPKSFVSIAAGSSMRRHMATKSMTFLAGIGNFRPELENNYLKDYKHQLLGSCEHAIDHWEKPFFDIMMEFGWHKSLRTALKIVGFDAGYRKPMTPYDEGSFEYEEIKKAVKALMEK